MLASVKNPKSVVRFSCFSLFIISIPHSLPPCSTMNFCEVFEEWILENSISLTLFIVAADYPVYFFTVHGGTSHI